MKKILFILLITPFIFLSDNVYASNITEDYTYTDRYFLEDTGLSLEDGYQQSSQKVNYGGFSFSTYSNLFSVFYFGGTGYDKYINSGIEWSNKNWCNGGSILFTGYLVPQLNSNSQFMFQNSTDWNLNIEVKSQNYYQSCSLVSETANGVPILKFTCSVPGSSTSTRSFKFVLSMANIALTGEAYYGIERNSFSYSCDIDTGDIISNDNQNTQNVINNQNQNTQNVINNQNANTNAIIGASGAHAQLQIDNANQNQAQTNQRLDDLNNNLTNATVEGGTGSSFFNDFSTTDNGGISDIITAPLVAINAMLDNSCTPMSTTYKGKEIILPCGTEFWSKAEAIKVYLNWFEGGILVYLIIRKLYKLIESMKNPDDDRVEVMNL